jgi:hypothetical protein
LKRIMYDSARKQSIKSKFKLQVTSSTKMKRSNT